MKCTTHHCACNCREAAINDLAKAANKLIEHISNADFPDMDSFLSALSEVGKIQRACIELGVEAA